MKQILLSQKVLVICLSSMLFACSSGGGGGSGETAVPSSPSDSAPPDTTPPIAPIILSPGASPYYSNNGSITISGSCETDALVSLSGASSQQVVCAASSFSFNVSKSSDAVYEFSVYQKDISNNVSISVGFVWNLDTSAPAAPTIISPSENPLTSSGSSVSLIGSCENGSTISITGAEALSPTCSSGEFSVSLSQNSDGTYNYSITQTDQAGNVSAASSLQWNRDSTLPPTPVISIPSTAIYYSNQNSVTITASCAGAGYNVNITGDLVSTDVSSPASSLTQACSSSPVSFVVQKSSDGTYNFAVNQENTTTLAQSAYASVKWIRDTAAPAAPAISSPASSPYTAPGDLTIRGVCESSARVYLTGDSTSDVACSSGSFQFVISKSTDATYNFSIHQVDLAGNSSTSSSIQWIRDSSAVPPPSITSPSISNYLSNQSTLNIVGTCTSGSTIAISGDVIAADIVSPSGLLTQTCSSGAFSYTIQKSADGTYNFSLKQTINSVDSSLVNQTWVLDTSAPDTSLTAAPTDPNLQLLASFSFSSPDTSATFECKLDTAAYSTCSSPMSFSSLANGAHTFSVRAKDAAGNIDATPVPHAWNQGAYNTIALFHFNTGNELIDSSLYSGSFNNNITNFGAASVTGVYGLGLDFESTELDYGTVTHNDSHGTIRNVMTIDFLVKFESLPTTNNMNVLLSKSGTSGAGTLGWELRVKKQGSNYILLFEGSLNGTSYTETKSSNCGFDTTSYFHVAVTWNKGSVKFYCNGVARGGGTIGTAGSSALYATTADIVIGKTGNMTGLGYFDGIIDELRISQNLRWSTSFTPPSAEYSSPD